MFAEVRTFSDDSQKILFSCLLVLFSLEEIPMVLVFKSRHVKNVHESRGTEECAFR